MSIADLRKDYSHSHLLESDIAADPMDQFQKWFDDAVRADVLEPNAMSLATASRNGRPSSRIVLLKGLDPRGFVWYTNYDSRKGQELAANPHAALLFHWVELERQVRIEGRVERVSAEESDEYFKSRPLKSRLGAIASAQSLPIESRDALENQLLRAEAEAGAEPARPVNWGGYRLIPDTMEFWQGRLSRLHDRIVYMLLPDGRWQHQRLQP